MKHRAGGGVRDSNQQEQYAKKKRKFVNFDVYSSLTIIIISKCSVKHSHSIKVYKGIKKIITQKNQNNRILCTLKKKKRRTHKRSN